MADLFNYLTTTKSKAVSKKGREKAGITEAIQGGYSKLQPLDPFESIDLLMSKENPSILCTDCYIDINNLCEIQRTEEEEEESDQENEWEHSDFDYNIFHIFDDEEWSYSFFLHCFSFIVLLCLS